MLQATLFRIAMDSLLQASVSSVILPNLATGTAEGAVPEVVIGRMVVLALASNAIRRAILRDNALTPMETTIAEVEETTMVAIMGEGTTTVGMEEMAEATTETTMRATTTGATITIPETTTMVQTNRQAESAAFPTLAQALLPANLNNSKENVQLPTHVPQYAPRISSESAVLAGVTA